MGLVSVANTQPRLSTFEGWTLREYAVVASTNLVAATLPAWSAVRSDTQTNGRGRFQRAWVSDEGGLWLSAVEPAVGDTIGRRAMPLAAGLAICESLQQLGVSHVRLRWPNDVLVDDRKLAGLLIDQFSLGLVVVGIGLNVRNRPENFDASLKNCTTRLADLLPEPPELPQLTVVILRHLRRVWLELERSGAAALFLRVNRLWEASRKVELDLDGDLRRGVFAGVDDQGRLILKNEAGTTDFYDAHQVRHLTET